MDQYMPFLWLAGFIIALAVEAGCICLLSVWFAGGALVALVSSLLGADIWLQVVLFFAVSIALLWLVRPLARKHFAPKLHKTNVDAVVGSTGVALSPITDDAGTVKLGGMEWSARSTSGETIPQGSHIRVDEVQGVRAFVTKI